MTRLHLLSLLLLLAAALPGPASARSLPPGPPGNPPSPVSITDPIPIRGDQSLLVVLVDFPDLPGTLNGTAWVNYFFNLGGFADYFREVSYNQLNYDAANGDIVGADGLLNEAIDAYVRLPNPITYYANGQYGYDMTSFPQNNGGVVRDALQALENAGFDFSPYANAIGGMVENLVVIFAGANYGYTGDANGSLEATAYRLADAGLGGEFVSSGGQRFNNYTFCPELYGFGGISRVGLCAHEHGHSLGMYDLYNTSWSTTGVGFMDLMGYGLYGADLSGSVPFQPGAVTKERLGWSLPSTLPASTYIIMLDPAEQSDDIIRLYPRADPGSGEYFLLENRQPVGFDSGWEDAGLCPGLLIWHVDRNIVDQYDDANLVNTQYCADGDDCPPHPGVVLVEADGNYDMLNSANRGECEDTWMVGQTWDDASIPSSRLWNGGASHLSVTVLAESGGVLTLDIEVQAVYLEYNFFLPVVTR